MQLEGATESVVRMLKAERDHYGHLADQLRRGPHPSMAATIYNTNVVIPWCEEFVALSTFLLLRIEDFTHDAARTPAVDDGPRAD